MQRTIAKEASPQVRLTIVGTTRTTNAPEHHARQHHRTQIYARSPRTTYDTTQDRRLQNTTREDNKKPSRRVRLHSTYLPQPTFTFDVDDHLTSSSDNLERSPGKSKVNTCVSLRDPPVRLLFSFDTPITAVLSVCFIAPST